MHNDGLNNMEHRANFQLQLNFLFRSIYIFSYSYLLTCMMLTFSRRLLHSPPTPPGKYGPAPLALRRSTFPLTVLILE